MPIVLGTIKCDNPDTLDELLATHHKPKSEEGSKITASAVAGSPAQLPHLNRELNTVTKPAHHFTTVQSMFMFPKDKKAVNTCPDPASTQLTGTTTSGESSGTSTQNVDSVKAVTESSPHGEPYGPMSSKPVGHDHKYYHKKYKLKRCTVPITHLTSVVSSKPLDLQLIKLMSI